MSALRSAHLKWLFCALPFQLHSLWPDAYAGGGGVHGWICAWWWVCVHVLSTETGKGRGDGWRQEERGHLLTWPALSVVHDPLAWKQSRPVQPPSVESRTVIAQRFNIIHFWVILEQKQALISNHSFLIKPSVLITDHMGGGGINCAVEYQATSIKKLDSPHTGCRQRAEQHHSQLSEEQVTN